MVEATSSTGRRILQEIQKQELKKLKKKKQNQQTSVWKLPYNRKY